MAPFGEPILTSRLPEGAIKVVPEYHSQIGQDIFVYWVLKYKKEGFFVDIGAHEPIYINNTYLLETKFNWSGVLIELDSQYVNKYSSVRNCNFLCADARKVDYRVKFHEWGFPKDIDYLSLDLDPPGVTFECLKQLPLDEYRFAVVTYEHDLYRSNTALKGFCSEEYRTGSREIFKSYGYDLICPDVTWHDDLKEPFEDWWVHPELVDMKRLDKIRTDKSTFWKDIILCQKQEEEKSS